jgi:cation transport ATPase
VTLDKTPSVRARRFQPTRTLPPDRPQAPSQPCAACGAEVDPLRAPCVTAFEDGVRLLCSELCRESHRSGERSRRRTQPLSPTPTATPISGAPKSKTGSGPVAIIEARSPLVDPFDRATAAWVWVGAATIGTAATLACFRSTETAFASALLTCLAAGAALRLTTQTIPDVGVLAWLLGPLGAMAAAVSAYSAVVHGDTALPLFGAVLAATAMLGRAMLDTDARRPVEHTLQGLLRALPSSVHVPSRTQSETSTLTTELVDTAKLRVGEEIVARRGELLGVDGTIQMGEATLLPYPGATSSVQRGPGDTVLAGARVTDGTLRVLASRVGDDRALVRVACCGRAGQRDAAPFLRATQALTRWAAAAILLLCIALVLFGEARGLTLPLSAASAILLAAPFLAVRRAAEWPLVGAATTAGARGILFQSGETLDLAGRVSVVAMAPHRTLTEGKPEVVDLLSLGDDNISDLLGLVAGAELVAGEHAIGRAVVTYAAKRGVAPVPARRAVAVPGRGLTGTGPNGEEVVVGSRRLLLDQGVSVAAADAYAARAEASGRTVVFVAVAGRVRAVFALQDHLRAGARAAVQRLFDLGLEVVLLTGDQRGPIEQLAAGFDIAHIKCELLPEERGQEVRSLREAGGGVAVIGYTGEDSAALAAADVAIALGGAGGGAGDNTIALVSEDLRDAAAALWIARAARARALGSVRIALIAFAAVAAAAVSGLVQPGLAAVAALLIDTQGIHAGARLLRRIALRLPAGS